MNKAFLRSRMINSFSARFRCIICAPWRVQSTIPMPLCPTHRITSKLRNPNFLQLIINHFIIDLWEPLTTVRRGLHMYKTYIDRLFRSVRRNFTCVSSMRILTDLQWKQRRNTYHTNKYIDITLMGVGYSPPAFSSTIHLHALISRYY